MDNTAVDPQLLDRLNEQIQQVLRLKEAKTAALAVHLGSPIVHGDHTNYNTYLRAKRDYDLAAEELIPALLADREATARKGIALQERVEFLEKALDQATKGSRIYSADDSMPENFSIPGQSAWSDIKPELAAYLRGKRAVADSKETEVKNESNG